MKVVSILVVVEVGVIIEVEVVVQIVVVVEVTTVLDVRTIGVAMFAVAGFGSPGPGGDSVCVVVRAFTQ